MEGVPEMPAVPAAGEAVPDELVGEAVETCARREHMCENASTAGKRRRGADSKRVFQITAAAALPQVSNLNDMLQRLEQGLQEVKQGQKQLLALAGNERARRLNHRSVNSPGHAVLQRLRRESEATAGSPALGDLPSQGGPQGIFPADTQALSKLKNPQINALERFYGVQFQGDSVEDRRKTFQDFICHD